MSHLTDEPTIALDHPKWQRAEIAVFTRRVVADCMSHRCTIVDGNRIKQVLAPEVRDVPWFDESNPEQDPDTPSGTVVRTAVHNEGCLFLTHDNRGCAIHRASIEQGWDFRGVKPTICRLFPLTYGEGAIFVSDDYPDYSCAYHPDAPTLYQVAREAIGDIFGPELVQAMDVAEQQVLAMQPKRLAVLRDADQNA
jgi:Fe-S-cluster containining protein